MYMKVKMISINIKKRFNNHIGKAENENTIK